MLKVYSAVILSVFALALYPEIKKNQIVFPVKADRGNLGTAFRVEHKGRVFGITAAHICQDSEKIENRNTHEKYEILHLNPQEDLCVFGLPQSSILNGKLSQRENHVGKTISIVGYPFGNRDTQQGLILNPSLEVFVVIPQYSYSAAEKCPEKALTIDYNGTCKLKLTGIRAKILSRPGNSGGPAFDSGYEIIGMVSSYGKLKDTIPVSTLMPSRVILKALDSLTKN